MDVVGQGVTARWERECPWIRNQSLAGGVSRLPVVFTTRQEMGREKIPYRQLVEDMPVGKQYATQKSRKEVAGWWKCYNETARQVNEKKL